MSNDAPAELPVETLLGMKAPYNPRKIEPGAFERLCASLREFGCGDPITLNRRSPAKGWPAGTAPVIVGGHQRVAAAAVCGMTTFPVFWGDWTSTQEMQLNIALNNPSLQGKYDEPSLRELLKRIAEDGGDLAPTGFDDLELARFLKRVGGARLRPTILRSRCRAGRLSGTAGASGITS